MVIGRNSAGSSKTVVGELRRAQLITAYGPGAIVDLPDMSVVVASTDGWDSKCRRIHDRNLETLLGVREFREPVAPFAKEGEGTVPVRRFPSWHYCPSCKKLAPYSAIAGTDKKRCSGCGVPLIPSRFVLACENGHLEEFPYRWWVHRGADCGSRKPLEISFSSKTRGIEGIKIKCPECGANRTMAGCTDPKQLKAHRCFGRRPWIGNASEDSDPVECDCEMHTIQRTAANAYYPITISALTMPPSASSVVESYWDQLKAVSALIGGQDESSLRGIVKAILVAENITESDLDEIMYEISLRGSKAGSVALTKQRIYQAEYHTLVGEDHDGMHLKTTHVGVPKGFEGFIADVTLVKRLREIMVIQGFRRIKPERSDGEETMASLSRDPLNWLPGVELLGEGIFIKFNSDAVERWSASVADRYEKMRQRLVRSNVRCDAFSPQYVLLHTFAHILIRQLSMECGYSASSLKERIYSTYQDDDYKMCGVLIYTSSSDSDGSLGGLVRCGRPEHFGTTLNDALRNAAWCSSDPLCSEADAQGYKSLNYAACHACALLPETSCEMRNCLLDRGAVVGTLEQPELGFFSAASDSGVFVPASFDDCGYSTALNGGGESFEFSVEFDHSRLGRLGFVGACESVLNRYSSDALTSLVHEMCVCIGGRRLETPCADVEFFNQAGEAAFASLAWEQSRVVLLDEECLSDFNDAFGDGWKKQDAWTIFVVGSCSAVEILDALKEV